MCIYVCACVCVCLCVCVCWEGVNVCAILKLNHSPIRRCFLKDDEVKAITASFNDSNNPFVFATEIITLLKLMCEGHNEQNQLMMREQPSGSTSVVSKATPILPRLGSSHASKSLRFQCRTEAA